MTVPPKTNFLPPTNRRASWARPFWDGVARSRLLAQECARCDIRFFPPRPYCPQCLGDRLDWLELSGRGTLHSWTEVRAAGPEFDTPFLLGLVDLEGGIGRLAAKIVDAEVGRLQIGMPVRVSHVSSGADFEPYCLLLPPE